MFRSTLSRTVLNAAAATKASRTGVSPSLARGYHEKVISHYESPRNVRFIRRSPLVQTHSSFRLGGLSSQGRR